MWHTYGKMADTEASLKELCNYCKRKTLKKIVKCKKCDKVYHNSCATRVLCCETKLTEQKTDFNEEDDKDILTLTYLNEELLTENQELKQKNQDLNEQITQLMCDVKKIQSDNDQYKMEILKRNKEDKKHDDLYISISNEIEKKFSIYSKELNSLKVQLSKLELITQGDKTKQQTYWGQKISTTDNKTLMTEKLQYNPITRNGKPETPKQCTKQTLHELQNKQMKIMSNIINLEAGPTINTEPILNTKEGNENQQVFLHLTPERHDNPHKTNDKMVNNIQEGFTEVKRKKRRQQGRVGHCPSLS